MKCQVLLGSLNRPLACWACGFESRRGNGCLSIVSGVCCTGSGLCIGLITRPEESYRVFLISKIFRPALGLAHLPVKPVLG